MRCQGLGSPHTMVRTVYFVSWYLRNSGLTLQDRARHASLSIVTLLPLMSHVLSPVMMAADHCTDHTRLRSGVHRPTETQRTLGPGRAPTPAGTQTSPDTSLHHRVFLHLHCSKQKIFLRQTSVFKRHLNGFIFIAFCSALRPRG